jgi:hypothetical protein
MRFAIGFANKNARKLGMLLCPLSRRPLVLITQKPSVAFSGKPIATEKSTFPAIEVV